MDKVYSLRSIENKLKCSDQCWVQIVGANQSVIQLLLKHLEFEDSYSNIVVVLPTLKDMSVWSKSLASLLSRKNNVFPMPVSRSWGIDRYVSKKQEKVNRLRSLYSLGRRSLGPSFLITTFEGLAQKTLSKSTYDESTICLSAGENIDVKDFVSKLNTLGYRENYLVGEEGEYSLRGGIIDVFTFSEESPVRIELIGESVASIRIFSQETQRSIRPVESIYIVPAYEYVNLREDKKYIKQKIFDYLIELGVKQEEINQILSGFAEYDNNPGVDAIFPLTIEGDESSLDFLNSETTVFMFPLGFERCLERFKVFLDSSLQLFKGDVLEKRACVSVEETFVNLQRLSEFFQKKRLIEFNNPIPRSNSRFFDVGELLCVPLDVNKSPEDVLGGLLKVAEEGFSVVVLCEFNESIKRLEDLLSLKDSVVYNSLSSFKRTIDDKLIPGVFYLTPGFIDSFVCDLERKVVFLPEKKILGIRQVPIISSDEKLKKLVSSLKELAVGDLVVHVDHGIGRYEGLKQIKAGENKEEFLVVSYRGSDKVYLPVINLAFIQKYKKSEKGRIPALDKLGGESFIKRKVKASLSAEKVAKEILDIQAKRKFGDGLSHTNPGELYDNFVEDFPYQETDDQIRCEEEINSDLASKVPMERMLIGDVGFGKTEIALRAVVRCILNGYQAIFLVPTTVLCHQHFTLFEQRLSKVGIVAQYINRFINKTKRSKTLGDFLSGKIDLLVGTHSLLSKEIKSNKLGLVVIDEEQRFGVVQKERVKRLEAKADFLYLSATPIPRSLHLAIVGLTDVSIIATPPPNRLPIKTIISKYDEDLIRLAIESEVKRGGQVFFVHNKVSELPSVCQNLSNLMPDIKIKFAHGQLKSDGVDKLIVGFLNREFDVLICTTIIESGVDMPNVNTLIVNKAHMFGLSQLYQIKGRVGRSSVQSYAYMLLPNMQVSNEALKRLEILSTYQGLGSGFQIASHDLEIRGAGNIVGQEQSGHIASIGLELYIEMLEKHMKNMETGDSESYIEPEIKIKINAIIPDNFIENYKVRLNIYKELFSASDPDSVDSILHTIEDSYGKVPVEIMNLISVARLKSILGLLSISFVSEIGGDTFELKFSKFMSSSKFSLIFKKINNIEGVLQSSADQRRCLLKLPKSNNILKKHEKINLLFELLKPLFTRLE